MRSTLTFALVAGLMVSACNKNEQNTPAQPAEPPTTVLGQPAAAPPGIVGKVVETMDSGGYTYVLIDTGAKKVWAATTQFKTAVGEEVKLPGGMPMRNFKSESLNRTFDEIYFVDTSKGGMGGGMAGAMPAGGDPMQPAGHPDPTAGSAGDVKLEGIAKAEGGYTIADLFGKKAELTGKEVKVRGKVVKFNSGIMGKNWVHLRDGSGGEGTNDLTVTTMATAKVGDTVLVTGKIATDKDFGAGYKYDLIVEDGAIATE